MKQLVAACIAAFYSEGPGGGHYDNMMGNYGTLGCGIYQSGAASRSFRTSVAELAMQRSAEPRCPRANHERVDRWSTIHV